jgi:FlaA1/EpsC-like NDP-sugar epimerase
MRYILGRLKADVVFHAAAYKHVPMMEENPVAAIENNVLGTDNLLAAARESGVKRFVLISTDKAVDPVSVYGASKQLCERLVLQAGKEASAGHNFMVVRFGNVLGSRGSIMPLFQRQIEKGGPVTVTHKDAERWFMTIPEACSLVLKAGGVGDNGKLYLLDMGDPVRIRDLAEQMIRFYGFEPEKDIKIEYIGLRSGERLGERLWSETETPIDTKYPRIRRVERQTEDDYDLSDLIRELNHICRFDASKSEAYRNSSLLGTVLRRAVPTIMIGEHERSF